jgi:hypothetical protein
LIWLHLLAQIRAGAEPTEFEDDEEVETVSDGELHERDADDTLGGGREIVAISDDDDIDDTRPSIHLFTERERDYYFIFFDEHMYSNYTDQNYKGRE